MGFINGYFAPEQSRRVTEHRKSLFPSATDVQDLPRITYTEEKSEKSDEYITSAAQYQLEPGTPTVGSIHESQLSSYPVGDFRNNEKDELRDIKCDVMVNWLYQQQMEMLWTAGAADEGVVLKKARGTYTCCPADVMEEPFGFFKAVEMLNVKVGLTSFRALRTPE